MWRRGVVRDPWQHPARRTRATLLVGLLLLSMAGWGAVPVAAQAPTPPAAGTIGPAAAAPAGSLQGSVQADSSAQVNFGSDIRFTLRAQSSDPIRSVLLLYQVDDSVVQNTAVPSYQPGTSVTAAYTWRVAGVLLPGSQVRYQWQIETGTGKTLTPEQTITYNDTRFSWREARADRVTVYYVGDPSTGQQLLDEANKVLDRLSREFLLTPDQPLRIFAYTRQQDYVSALAGTPTDVAMTVGGDRIFVLAPAGTANMATSLQALRREVANAIFVQKTRNPYADPPRWLQEGFGPVVAGEEISPQNYRTLGQYAQANRLLPLKTLNGNFPNNDRDYTLAYFESVSVVRYIFDTYGPEKLKALLAAYKEGTTVDDGLKKGLGVTLDQLESRWKNALKSGAAARAASAGGASSAAGAAGQGAGAGAAGPGGVFGRLLDPAVSYWQGVLGRYTRPVLAAVAGFIVLGLLSVIAGTLVVWVRRARAED
jgi:hypothetical protein